MLVSRFHRPFSVMAFQTPHTEVGAGNRLEVDHKCCIHGSPTQCSDYRHRLNRHFLRDDNSET